ncbi:hypothetical protein [Bythopirellula polymerisocia]|nr:hypothetical protein [Bythopirellula polymerisocia]
MAASRFDSVVSGRDTSVSIHSSPSSAQVKVSNEKGETVATGITPAKVSLKRGNGFFKKAPRYTATIQKPGYEAATVAIVPKVNPWVLGNVTLGGVPGVAADSATGAMWRYSPDDINQSLTPYNNELYSKTDQSQLEQTAYVSD